MLITSGRFQSRARQPNSCRCIKFHSTTTRCTEVLVRKTGCFFIQSTREPQCLSNYTQLVPFSPLRRNLERLSFESQCACNFKNNWRHNSKHSPIIHEFAHRALWFRTSSIRLINLDLYFLKHTVNNQYWLGVVFKAASIYEADKIRNKIAFARWFHKMLILCLSLTHWSLLFCLTIPHKENLGQWITMAKTCTFRRV